MVERFTRIFGTVFVVVGISAQAVAGYLALEARSWLATSATAVGTCTAHEARSSRGTNGRRNRSKAERVVFRDQDGNEHEFVSSFSSSSPFAIGSQVPVRYDPAQPSVAAVDTTFRNWFAPGLVAAVGLVMTGVGFGFRLRS